MVQRFGVKLRRARKAANKHQTLTSTTRQRLCREPLRYSLEKEETLVVGGPLPASSAFLFLLLLLLFK